MKLSGRKDWQTFLPRSFARENLRVFDGYRRLTVDFHVLHTGSIT